MKAKKYIFILMLLSFHFTVVGQQKIALPIDSAYTIPLYSMYFTSSNSFLATTYEDEEEFIHQFSFEDGRIKDMGKMLADSGVAIGGQINGLPYLYLQHSGDVIPGYPDDSPFSFISYAEEIYVAGFLENQLVIVKENGVLNICEALGTGENVRYKRISISNPRRDENGIFILADSLYFSRIDNSGYYKLYKSVYDRDISDWGEPRMMSEPYNHEKTNSLFYLWYEGAEYISSDRNDGILSIYIIGSDTTQNKLWVSVAEKNKKNKKIQLKVRDKTYEEYVSFHNYGFYNQNVGLTDEMRVEEGDTVYVLEVPQQNLRKVDLKIVGKLQNKKGRKDIFLAKNTNTGEKITLLPVDFAKKNGLEVAGNTITKENLSHKDFLLLGGITYVAYSHSLFDPNVLKVDIIATRTSRSYNTTTLEDLKKAINSKREFSQEELEAIFGSLSDTCYTQVGFYKNRIPNTTFWRVFRGKYNVVSTYRSVNGRVVGTQYIIANSDLKEAFASLNYTIKSFYKYKINDVPFIRIGKWNKNFTIIKLVNGKYIVEQ